MIPWWTAVSAADAEHPCGTDLHPLRWADGALHVPGHDDPDAERTLAALGGAVAPCISLREAWATWSGDPSLVTLGRRPGEEGLAFAAADAPLRGAGLHMAPVRRRQSDPARRDDLVRLLSLPTAFVDRLVLTAMATAAEQWSEETFRGRHGLRLGAALAARAQPALQRSVAGLGALGEAVVARAAPAPPGGGIDLRVERTTRGLDVMAALPLRWLASVWGTGLSEPDGRLVVDLVGSSRGGYDVEVVEWVPAGAGRWIGEVRGARLDLDEGGAWRVRSLAS